MIIHGGLMELSAFLMLVPVLAFGLAIDDISQNFSFSFPYFQDNMIAMMIMSGIFGAARLIGAIGVLKNRMWALCYQL